MLDREICVGALLRSKVTGIRYHIATTCEETVFGRTRRTVSLACADSPGQKWKEFDTGTLCEQFECVGETAPPPLELAR